jgi:hypothetical protein
MQKMALISTGSRGPTFSHCDKLPNSVVVSSHLARVGQIVLVARRHVGVPKSRRAHGRNAVILNRVRHQVTDFSWFGV